MLPELQHNLKLVVDLAESDITKFDGKIRSEKDTLEILRREKVRLSKQAAHDELAARVKSALALVEKCNAAAQSCGTTEEFGALTKSWMEVVKQFPRNITDTVSIVYALTRDTIRPLHVQGLGSNERSDAWIRRIESVAIVGRLNSFPMSIRRCLTKTYEDLLRDPMLARLLARHHVEMGSDGGD